MSGQFSGRILTRRDLLHDDIGQLEIEPACGDGRDLRQGGVLDHDDRAIGRLAPMTLDDLPDGLLVFSRDRREQANRTIRSYRMPRGARSGSSRW